MNKNELIAMKLHESRTILDELSVHVSVLRVVSGWIYKTATIATNNGSISHVNTTFVPELPKSDSI